MEALTNEITNYYFLSEKWFDIGKFIFDYLNGTREGFNGFIKLSSEIFPEEYDELCCMKAWIAYDNNLSFDEFLEDLKNTFLL